MAAFAAVSSANSKLQMLPPNASVPRPCKKAARNLLVELHRLRVVRRSIGGETLHQKLQCRCIANDAVGVNMDSRRQK